MVLAGCSSAPLSAPTLPDGALPPGTARVTVNGNDTGPIHDVECQSLGEGFTTITIGRRGTRTAVLVDEDIAKGVTFNDVEGFTGSYWQDLQGNVRLSMVDQTYTLTGTAAGFNHDHPYTRAINSFTVTVAC